MDRAHALAPPPHHRHDLLPPRMLRMAYRIDAYALLRADLMVSAGGVLNPSSIDPDALKLAEIEPIKANPLDALAANLKDRLRQLF